MQLDVRDGIELLYFAFDQENEDRLFQRWIQFAQNTMSFDDFKHELEPVKAKPDKEILADCAAIVNSMRGTDGNI